MSEKTHNQSGSHSPFFLDIYKRLVDSRYDSLEGNSTIGMCLRIKEYFRMDDIVFMSFFEILPGEIVKIFLGDQHTSSLIIDIQKILQITKIIRLLEGSDRRIFDSDVVTLRNFKH